MNVASLDLCKELYELSGWGYNETDKVWCHGKLKNKGLIDTREVHEHLPAYDLGYLLRKLVRVPFTLSTVKRYQRFRLKYGKLTYEGTPEDIVAKLAIELFKQGILKADERTGE